MYLDLMSGITDAQRKKLGAEVNQDLIKKNEYDKFGDGQYLDVDTYRRLLNDIFSYVWSFEIVETKEIRSDNSTIDFVLVKGRLIIPGVGVKEAYGTGKADKKNNSSMYSAATSYAFKSCCKMAGIGAAFNDENFFEPLYEDDIAPEPKKENKPAKKDVEDEPEEKPTKASKKQEENEPEEKPAKGKGGAEWSKDELKKMDQLKKTYDIQTKEEFVAFAQIWNPKIKSMTDLDPATCMELYDYVEENTEEFEDFDPSEVA